MDLIDNEAQARSTTPQRLRILGDDEIDELYARPTFAPDERTQFFSLSQPEKDLLQELRSLKSQAYFVLQLGYFKAKHLFFNFDLDKVKDDTQFVLEQHFDGRHLDDLSAVDKKTRLKQQRLILQLLGYRNCNRFIRETQDVLWLGPPGVGKSFLVQAIGYQAIKAGFVVYYRSIFDLVRDFMQDEAFNGHDKILNRYLKPDLLIIDDMGIKELPKKSGEFLFEIIMRRYELRSTMMTTNRPLEDGQPY